MNFNELKQVHDDLERGVMVCSATIRRVVDHAMAQAVKHVEDETPEQVLKDVEGEVFPIRLELLRHMFEKKYGPKDGFAWRTPDDKYKSAALQEAWELWQQASTEIMMHLTGAWPADEDCAKRLRAVCKLVGIADVVPQSDDDLWASAFSVLGMVRKRLKDFFK